MTAYGGEVLQRVAQVSEFSSSKRLVRTVDSVELLLLLRGANEVIALHNFCTHLGESLERGRIMGGQITCPFHGACFDLRSGTALSGPAVASLHVFPACLRGDEVFVDLSRRPAATGFHRRLPSPT